MSELMLLSAALSALIGEACVSHANNTLHVIRNQNSYHTYRVPHSYFPRGSFQLSLSQIHSAI